MATSKQYENALGQGYVLRGGKREYVIENILGRGGFGITYKVKTKLFIDNITVDVHFAVKEYFPDICWRDDRDNATLVVPRTKSDEVLHGIRDFINEGLRLQKVCKLNHNIVNVNEVFEANGTAYYVLEYLEGGDLITLVKDNGRPLTDRQMLEVMRPIGDAVQCLHDNSILHLDIKPSNIVMRRNHDMGTDEPVLIDFGIAVHFDSSGTPTSKTPSLGISPGYSPIEQYTGLREFDPRLDVYAFAATCLYLLTGKDPVETIKMSASYVQDTLPPQVSDNVKNALVRAMSMSRDQRTASIGELMQEMTLPAVERAVPVMPKVSKPTNIAPPPLIPSQEPEQRFQVPSGDMPVNANSDSTFYQPKPKKSKVKKILSIIAAIFAFLLFWVIVANTCSNMEKASKSSSTDDSESAEMVSSTDIVSTDEVSQEAQPEAQPEAPIKKVASSQSKPQTTKKQTQTAPAMQQPTADAADKADAAERCD